MTSPISRRAPLQPTKVSPAPSAAASDDPFRALSKLKATDTKSLTQALANIARELELTGISPAPDDPAASKLCNTLSSFSSSKVRQQKVAEAIRYVTNQKHSFENRLAVFEAIRRTV